MFTLIAGQDGRDSFISSEVHRPHDHPHGAISRAASGSGAAIAHHELHKRLLLPHQRPQLHLHLPVSRSAPCLLLRSSRSLQHKTVTHFCPAVLCDRQQCGLQSLAGTHGVHLSWNSSAAHKRSTQFFTSSPTSKPQILDLAAKTKQFINLWARRNLVRTSRYPPSITRISHGYHMCIVFSSRLHVMRALASPVYQGGIERCERSISWVTQGINWNVHVWFLVMRRRALLLCWTSCLSLPSFSLSPTSQNCLEALQEFFHYTWWVMVGIGEDMQL